jgi:thiamine biosynthesis protein ThiS
LRIHVNGEPHEVADELSLQDLVNLLNLAPKRLAIELNQNVVRRADWAAMILREDDRVEIVHFVGGGVGKMNAERATTRFSGASKQELSVVRM